MKHLKTIYCILYIVVALYSTTLYATCGVRTVQIKDSVSTPFIQFGSGGGFTGGSTNYILTQKGQLYTRTETTEGKNTDILIKKISSCKTKKIFRYINKKQVMQITLDDPGNMYSYISIHQNTVHTLTWNNSSTVPKRVLDLNSILHSIL